jgi:hypothetical protein
MKQFLPNGGHVRVALELRRQLGQSLLAVDSSKRRLCGGAGGGHLFIVSPVLPERSVPAVKQKGVSLRSEPHLFNC